jgi:hypothetical protein
MTASWLKRRDLALVVTTAAVCFGIAVPLTSASSSQPQTQFTVWPGNSARYANMDWSCDYSAEFKTKDGTRVAAQINCARESTPRGLRVTITGDHIGVDKCGGGTGSRLGWCNKIIWRTRTP